MTVISESMQKIVYFLQSLLLSDDIFVRVVTGILYIVSAIAIIILFAFTYSVILKNMGSNAFPNTTWSEHVKDVHRYKKFLEEYSSNLERLITAPKSKQSNIIKAIHHQLRKHNVDFVDPVSDTMSKRISCLPVFFDVDVYCTKELPKGFSYVTNPGRYKSFKTMHKVHCLLNILCLAPAISVATMIFVLVVELYVSVLSIGF